MDVTLFMSLYALFNFYIYLVTYFYCPAIGSNFEHRRGANFESVDAEKERQEIMKSFYETELQEDDEEKHDGVQNRKKASKIWESIS